MDIRKNLHVTTKIKQNTKHNFGIYFCLGLALMEFFVFSFFMLNPSLHASPHTPTHPPTHPHIHTHLLPLFKEKLPPRASLFYKYSRYEELMFPADFQQLS